MENVVIDSAFWAGKRVFLTGHTGFKGGWLSLWLQSLGAQVTGFALAPPEGPNLFTTARVAQEMTSLIGDIRNLTALTDAVRQARPEIVLHLAAQPLVRYSYEAPVETYSTNVMGTVHLLEAVRACPSVRSCVIVSSDKCYENREWPWGYRENEAMGGYDPYSSSKGCTELVAAAYRNSYFNPASHAQHGVALASARAGNVIGGGDWASDRLVPDLLRAFETSKPALIRNPHAIRPWQHVLEPVSGYLVLAQRLHRDGVEFAEGWNFGPNDVDAKPVGWIAAQMAQVWGGDAAYRIDETTSHPHEAHYLKLDCSKARSRLSWQPRWDLSRALNEVVSWHRAYLERDDVRDVCLQQISRFCEA
ncbi:CDP-glucose 4,6-dehydratase [Trinickia acidisoli]|uniref:CDP-glucose 4,6-dehydratase n=1 Tax=Trinickia acidisoli TaxID=2767482 RepID=UPI002852E1DA|nr:CDP-glucose 4,6-dehydratase [Trinickia acidisoli]